MSEVEKKSLKNRISAIDYRINYLLDEIDIKVTETDNLSNEKDRLVKKLKDL